MIYVLSVMSLLLGLTWGIPALKQYLRMREIDRNGITTSGRVTSSKSATGWLWTAAFGNQERPLVTYQSPSGKEIILEVTTSSIAPIKRYQTGDTVTVVYDRESPGKAYSELEKQPTQRDLFVSGVAITLSISLWAIGNIYGLPY